MHWAWAAMEGSALEEMALWGPLPAAGASLGSAGPSLAVGVLLRAPQLSIWKMERNTQS